jgi:Malectin domain
MTPMTSTVTWTGGAGTTNWTDAANWSTDALPGAGADVVVNVATATTIQIAYANVSIDSLTTNAQLSLGLESSLTATTLNASANVLLQGGTIANTTINMSPGSALVGSAYPGGTLDGVTASGLLDMSNAIIDIADGLTLNNATLLMGDTNGTTFGTLLFDNTETLGGTGTIILGNQSTASNQTNTFGLLNPSLTVTIGSGITIRGNSATFQGYNIGEFIDAGSFINQGTIAADASVAPGNFAYDTGYSGGSTATFATAINTSGVTNPAPQQVYQSMRYGLGFGYTLSGLTPGASYTVRLDFASLWNIGAGTQAFNVSINGTQVLSNYDVYAGAGGLDRATAQRFSAVANANGQILLNFASVKYEAQINGIEVLSGNTQVMTVAAGSVPGGITFGLVQDNEPPVFINDGTLDASNGETLAINGPWTNAAGGTINSSGATLSLGDPAGYYDPWSNAGTINVTGSTLNLGGSFTTAGLGTLNQSANTINLIGKFDNTGTTLALTPATGSWNLLGGTLTNGTLTESGGAELVFTVSGGTLDGVTVDGNLDLTGTFAGYQSPSANLANDVVLDGTAYLGNATGSTGGELFFNNNAILSGTGTVIFGGSGGELSGGTMTIGPGITILGSRGTISATSLINQGTIEAQVLNGSVGPYAQDTDFSGGSAYTITTPVDTSGVSNPPPEEVYQSARVGNFTYTLPNLTPGGQYTVRLDFTEWWTFSPGSEENVSINGTPVLTNFDIFVAAGAENKAVNETFSATANSSGQIVINFAGIYSYTTAVVSGIDLYSGATQLLAIDAGLVPTPGTMSVGTVTNEGTIEAASGETLTVYNLTNTSGSTLSFSGAFLNLNGALNNQPGGSIAATGGTVTLGDPSFTSTTVWTNSGSITVTNATLDLGGVFTLAGMGTIAQSADVVNLVGTLNNTGTTLALNAATGSWNLDAGILKNGTLTESGGAELVITGSGGTLDGVTVDGILDLTGSMTSRPSNGEVYATVLDGMTLNGTANLGNASGSIGGELDFDNTETLSGAGTIVFGKSNNWLNSQYSSAGLTIGPGIVVHGSSGVVAGWSQYSALTDEGPIIVDDNGAAAALGPFVPDRLLSGSATDQFITNPIDTSAVSNPAPQAVYQTANSGNFAYTLPNLTPGVTYTVRLDFAELQASAAGQREMNVSINGTQVLTNFDIFATAGAQYKAIAESFSAIANAQGQIVINFAAASRWLLPASVNAIELYSGTTRLLAIDAGGYYADGIGLFPAGFGNGPPTPFYLNDPGYLSVPQGGVINISGSLLGNTHNASQYQVVGTLAVSGGTATTPQLFEAMSNDLGAVPAGFINNFADGTLDFGGYTQLVDQSRNSGSTQPEAVYADNLVVEPGATLNLNGLHLYVGSEEVAGTIVGGTVTVVTLPTPTVNAPAVAAVNENSTLAFTGTRSVSIGDPSGTAEQLTLSASHGTLAVSATSGVTITGNDTGTVVITGQIGSVNSAVGSLVYTPTPRYTGADVLTLSDQDQADGETGLATVAITVNAPPSIAAPAAASLSENGSYTFAGGSIALSDAAASGTSDSLTLSVSKGTLTLGSTTGLTFSSGANGTSSMTVTGTLANLNAALSGLTYKPASGYAGSDTLAISLFDSVDGLSASTNVALTIINSPPSITAPATATVIVTSTLTFSTANKNAVSIADVSAGSAVEPLTLTATNGTLTLGSTTGIAFSSGTNNSASMTINGTLANLNAALSGLTFKPATIGTATVVLSYTDVADGLLASATITITVSKGATKLGVGSLVSPPPSPAAARGASLSGPTDSGATPASIAGDPSNSSMPPDEEITQWAGVTAAVAVLNG